MADKLPNQYGLSNLPSLDPQVRRVMQDMTDRINFLTGEVERLKERDLVVMPHGAAKKENPVAGIITLPSPAGDGFIRVNGDGVIVAYSNPASMAGVPINVKTDFSTVNSVGGGPDVLHTFTLQAGSLRKDGDFVDILYAGSFAANDTDKSVQAQFDGTSYDTSGAVDIDGAVGWVMMNRIIRKTPTSVGAMAFSSYNALSVDSTGAIITTFNTGFFSVVRTTAGFTTANLSTTDVVMRVRSTAGAGAAAADIFQSMSIINLTRT